MSWNKKTRGTVMLAIWLGAWNFAVAQKSSEELTEKASKLAADDVPINVLSPAEWKRVDDAVDRGISWLARQQQFDGSFRSVDTGQPGVTSLCIMAFVSHGHTPSDRKYGWQLKLATDYVLFCQKENGLVTKQGPNGSKISHAVDHWIGVCESYNHAISSLLLTEMYGMSEPQRARRIEVAINRALAATLEMQRWHKEKATDNGGWRYIDNESDSDLSVTGWNLMFLRSARNAGFDVPKQSIDDAVAYIRRCYSKRYGTFEYRVDDADGRTRGMAGAGILALAHAGYHHSVEARRTGDWILKQKFEPYNTMQNVSDRDRYHYSLFNCCQGMYQLGGKYWREFFTRVEPMLLANQRTDGSWPADANKGDAGFGSAYTTALVVMTLGAPNQLLPIFQR